MNVHPNKSDVRFSDNRVIYGCIYSVVSSILDGNAGALSFLAGGGDVAAADGAESNGREEAAPVQSAAAGQPSAPFGNAVRPVGLSDELLVSLPIRSCSSAKRADTMSRAPTSGRRGDVEFRDSAAGYGDRTGAPFRDGGPDPVGAVRRRCLFPKFRAVRRRPLRLPRMCLRRTRDFSRRKKGRQSSRNCCWSRPFTKGIYSIPISSSRSGMRRI